MNKKKEIENNKIMKKNMYIKKCERRIKKKSISNTQKLFSRNETGCIEFELS